MDEPQRAEPQRAEPLDPPQREAEQLAPRAAPNSFMPTGSSAADDDDNGFVLGYN